jgi:hypothetical protein
MASVWFFPDDEGQPHVLTTDAVVDSIPLPPGNYRVLAFNGLLEYSPTRDEQTSGSFRHIGFRGTGRYETFEAFCRTPLTVTSARYSRAEDDQSALMASPEELACDHYRNDATNDVFSVTMSMVDKGARPVLEFAPAKLTAQLQLVVHVENLISAASFENANVAFISGLAESVLLASGKRGTTPVTHYFIINDRQYYEGSETDGTLRGGCLTFGLPQVTGDGSGNDNLLSLYFTLRNGDPYPVIERDLTGRFTQGEEDRQSGEEQLTLYVEVGAGSLGPDDHIRLPDTQDPGNPGSDFGAEMYGWGENVVYPIDI